MPQYTPHTWTTGEIITAAELNAIEQAAAAAAVATDVNATLATKVNSSTYTAGLAAKADTASLAAVAQTGSYTDLANKPTIPAALPTQTGNSGKFLTTDGSATSWTTVSGGTGAVSALTPTATKTTAYTAAVGDLAMMNVPGGATTLTLPAAPADKSQVGYRAIGATNAVPLTINRGGSDTIGTAGATSATIALADETVVLQYDAPNTRWLAVANVKTQPSLDAAYAARSRATTGVYVPNDWGANWHAKLAAAGSSLVKIGVAGDSVAAGYYTSNPRTKSWPALLAAALQSTYGDGGSGFNGAANTDTFAAAKSIAAGTRTAYAANNTYWTTSGAWALFGPTYGPNAYAITTTTVGATATIPGLRGTTIKIFTYCSSGTNANWTYSVDGATAVPVTDTGAFGIQTTTITGLSAGTHSVVIAYNDAGTKTLYLAGATAYNATGVVVDNYSVFGAIGWDFHTSGALPPGQWSGGSLNPCDLYIYALGANDTNTGFPTGVTAGAAVSAGASTITVSGYIPPGVYGIDSEVIVVVECTATTATLMTGTSASHASGVSITQPKYQPDVWARIAAANLTDARISGNGTTDLAIIMPNIGKYDTYGQFHTYGTRARALAEEFGAALFDLWPIGRNNWAYWNSLGYWGNSATPGGSGTDNIHLSDAGAAAYYSLIAPIVTAAS